MFKPKLYLVNVISGILALLPEHVHNVATLKAAIPPTKHRDMDPRVTKTASTTTFVA